MKRELLTIEEMTDSKEVYGERPNPAITWLLYILLAIFVAALAYSFFGSIEVTTTAKGIVRPNEAVSTVSPLIGGKITSIHYAEGVYVEEGETLFTVDSSELALQLLQLTETLDTYRFEESMNKRYLSALISSSDNPFSDDPESDEYPYYTSYETFLLQQLTSEQSEQYDISKTSETIVALKKDLSALQSQLEDLSALKQSIHAYYEQTGDTITNSAQFAAYVSQAEALQRDYLIQRDQILADATAAQLENTISNYQMQIVGYSLVIDFIRSGMNLCTYDDMYSRLYNTYVNTLDGYVSACDRAKIQYDQLCHNTVVAGESLSYYETMLEGYILLKRSVEQGVDCYNPTANSYYYHNLFESYTKELDNYNQILADANMVLKQLINENSSDEEIATASTVVQTAEKQLEDYRSNTILNADYKIQEIKALLAEKEMAYSSEFDLELAYAAWQIALSNMSAFQNSTIQEYQSLIQQLEMELENASIANSFALSQETQLATLEASYKQAVEKLTNDLYAQIETNATALEAEIRSTQANLNSYQTLANFYRENTTSDGKSLTVSLSVMQQISQREETLIAYSSKIEEIEFAIKEVELQIGQTQITAERSGIIHVVSECTVGDIIPVGTPIVTIIPFNESEYTVQLYVSSRDIADIEIGTPIKYNILALPSAQYGTVDGQVTSISQDTLVQDGQYSGYFLMEGSISSKALDDTRGNTGSIAIGMDVEGRIILHEKSIIQYVLEKLDIFN